MTYAVALTLEPARDSAGRIERLRSAGLSDEELLHATQITAYFNFVNRMAHGLGVELEERAT